MLRFWIAWLMKDRWNTRIEIEKEVRLLANWGLVKTTIQTKVKEMG